MHQMHTNVKPKGQGIYRYSRIPLSTEGGVLARYLEELRYLDPLTREEEQQLAYRVQQGDEEAKARLIQANLRFVVTVAKEYGRYGVPLSDLIGEGNLGLIQAADRFDPARGFRFLSYAVWWIRRAILRALTEQRPIVRMSRGPAERLHRIWATSRRLEQERGHRPTSTEIARELEVAPAQVSRTLAIGRWHRSLDAPLSPDDEARSLLDILDSGEPTPEEETLDRVLHEEIQGALDTLDQREAEVVRLYYGFGGRDPMTLDEIGQQCGLTQERVRQIHQRALSRLRYPSRAGRLIDFWVER